MQVDEWLEHVRKSIERLFCFTLPCEIMVGRWVDEMAEQYGNFDRYSDMCRSGWTTRLGSARFLQVALRDNK